MSNRAYCNPHGFIPSCFALHAECAHGIIFCTSVISSAILYDIRNDNYIPI